MEQIIKKVENEIKEEFYKNEEIERINSEKVLKAFKNQKISEMHLNRNNRIWIWRYWKRCN